MLGKHEDVKHFIDWMFAAFTVGAVFNWLPAIAALFSIIWYAIRIWESETVRKLTGRAVPHERGK